MYNVHIIFIDLDKKFLSQYLHIKLCKLHKGIKTHKALSCAFAVCNHPCVLIHIPYLSS